MKLLRKLNVAPSTFRHNSSFRIINSQSAETSNCWSVSSCKLPAILGLPTLLYYTRRRCRLTMPTAPKKKLPKYAKWKVGSNIFYDKVLPEIKGGWNFICALQDDQREAFTFLKWSWVSCTVPISDSHCKGMLPGPHLQGYGDKIKVARRNISLWFYTSQGMHILNRKAALTQLLRYFFLWSGILYYSKYSFSSNCNRTLNSVKKNPKQLCKNFVSLSKPVLVIVNFSPWYSKANNLSFNFTHVKCYTSNLGKKILN